MFFVIFWQYRIQMTLDFKILQLQWPLIYQNPFHISLVLSTNSWMDSTNLSTGIFLPASPFKRLLRHSYSVRNYFDELPIDEAARAYFIMDFCSFCVPCILKTNCIVPILFYVIYIPKYHTKTLNLPQNRLYFQRPQSFL